MNRLDDTDLRILNALQKTGAITPVFQALGHLGIEPWELGYRLELLAARRLIRVEGLSRTFGSGMIPDGGSGGTFAPGMNRFEGLGGTFGPEMSLPNGIHHVGLTVEGRQFLSSENQ